MEFRRHDSEGAELYCTEKATFTPFPSSTNTRQLGNSKHVASTPYHPVPYTNEKLENTHSITDSSDDPLLNDIRVIQYMVKSETNSVRTSSRYLHTTHITDNMRKILLRWMYEVVIDQKCEDLLFVLAANFLDRFLNSIAVEKGQLQLLGCCCLLLASKLRNSHIISTDMLAYLTDGCHTDQDICNFELVVLSQLGWEVSPVLPSDYLEPVIRQAGVGHVFAIQRHAKSFLSMATLYSCFLDYRPSFLGCAAVYAGLTYCEGRDSEEILLLDFVEKTFGINRQDMGRARALIFSSMDTELSLQSDQDQETVVLPAFEGRRDGYSEQDTSCAEVEDDLHCAINWVSDQLSFFMWTLYGFVASLLQRMVVYTLQSDDTVVKLSQEQSRTRSHHLKYWHPGCGASALAFTDAVKKEWTRYAWKHYMVDQAGASEEIESTMVAKSDVADSTEENPCKPSDETCSMYHVWRPAMVGRSDVTVTSFKCEPSNGTCSKYAVFKLVIVRKSEEYQWKPDKSGSGYALYKLLVIVDGWRVASATEGYQRKLDDTCSSSAVCKLGMVGDSDGAD